MNEKTQSSICKVRKNEQGVITEVMLKDGQVYSIDEAIQLAKDHLIEGVNVGRTKDGTEFLRSNPDDEDNNNLDNLPTF